MQQVASGKNETSPDYVPNETNEVISVANLVWRLLPSKEGGVLRRLLMTAVSAFPPFFFKKLFSLAEIICQLSHQRRVTHYVFIIQS